MRNLILAAALLTSSPALADALKTPSPEAIADDFAGDCMVNGQRLTALKLFKFTNQCTQRIYVHFTCPSAPSGKQRVVDMVDAGEKSSLYCVHDAAELRTITFTRHAELDD